MENMNELYSDIFWNTINRKLINALMLPTSVNTATTRAAATTSPSRLADIIQDGVVKDAAYTGHGCAISQASADIMIDLIKGKSTKKACAWSTSSGHDQAGNHRR